MTYTENKIGPQMDAFLARQPILNRDLQLHGYELLFRNGAEWEQHVCRGQIQQV